MGKVMLEDEDDNDDDDHDDWPEHLQLKGSAIRCKQESNTNVCETREN